MLTKNIKYRSFSIKNNFINTKKNLILLLSQDIGSLRSLKKSFKYNYSKNLVKKLKKILNVRVIGMGGSNLGSEAIYDFLKNKIKKKFIFTNNLNNNQKFFNRKKNILNLIISKSGNTLETISNVNILIKKSDKNIFITEKKNSYLNNLAKKLKAEIVEHKNFIGGRYSVLSEVGMLPAELMGLNEKKFKQLNNLIKNKNFMDNLVKNVGSTITLLKKKKMNSIILNYDEQSENLFKWYQQLVAESLGKKSKGILPIISTMPKDNHSLMQLYLDGPKNNFFTFFHVKNKKNYKIKSNSILASHKYLKNKNIGEIIEAQKIATEKVFLKKKIPFRSFEILNRNEETLGELFCFFILETILIGRLLKINPFDQPSVELIKTETKKILT
jgi:glucose-6-phosphate isomerase